MQGKCVSICIPRMSYSDNKKHCIYTFFPIKPITMKHLTAPRMDLCIGCQLCALACARVIYNQIGWNSSGIQIQKAQDTSAHSYSAHYCLACSPAPCCHDCPTEALRQRPGGGVLFTPALCVQCEKCFQSCPLGAIHRNDKGEISVCVHCGECISFCPQQCLEMQESLNP